MTIARINRNHPTTQVHLTYRKDLSSLIDPIPEKASSMINH